MSTTAAPSSSTRAPDDASLSARLRYYLTPAFALALASPHAHRLYVRAAIGGTRSAHVVRRPLCGLQTDRCLSGDTPLDR